MPTTPPITTYPLTPPSLTTLASILTTGLKKNYAHVSISISPCPDLTLPPYYLAAPGLCGNESIVDIGGPRFLHPVPDFGRVYDLGGVIGRIGEIERGDKVSKEGRENEDVMGNEGKNKGEGGKTIFAIGAAAGPFPHLGQNTELIPNFSITTSPSPNHKITNLTHYAKIHPSTQNHHCTFLPGSKKTRTSDCAFLANLYLSSGLPGDVLHIVVKERIGAQRSFTVAMKEVLENFYRGEDENTNSNQIENENMTKAKKEQPKAIALGGIFLLKKGKMQCHVMPDFHQGRLEDSEVKNWLRFYEWEGRGLVALTSFCAGETGLALRGGHTHVFEGDGEDEDGEGEGRRGGHYHGDTDDSKEEVVYEGWFGVARTIYRVDRPEEKGV